MNLIDTINDTTNNKLILKNNNSSGADDDDDDCVFIGERSDNFIEIIEVKEPSKAPPKTIDDDIIDLTVVDLQTCTSSQKRKNENLNDDDKSEDESQSLTDKLPIKKRKQACNNISMLADDNLGLNYDILNLAFQHSSDTENDDDKGLISKSSSEMTIRNSSFDELVGLLSMDEATTNYEDDDDDDDDSFINLDIMRKKWEDENIHTSPLPVLQLQVSNKKYNRHISSPSSTCSISSTVATSRGKIQSNTKAKDDQSILAIKKELKTSVSQKDSNLSKSSTINGISNFQSSNNNPAKNTIYSTSVMSSPLPLINSQNSSPLPNFSSQSNTTSSFQDYKMGQFAPQPQLAYPPISYLNSSQLSPLPSLNNSINLFASLPTQISNKNSNVVLNQQPHAPASTLLFNNISNSSSSTSLSQFQLNSPVYPTVFNMHSNFVPLNPVVHQASSLLKPISIASNIQIPTNSNDKQQEQSFVQIKQSSSNNNNLLTAINLIAYKYPRSNPSVVVETGSILYSKCTAIVNSIGCDSNLNPTFDGNLSKQIIEKAGTYVRKTIQSSNKLAFNADKTYSFIITSAGYLQIEKNINFIYHAHLDNFSYLNDHSEISFKNTIKNLLKLAIDENCDSIAFPTLGCGDLLYPASMIAKWFDEIIKTFFLAYTCHSLKMVKIVLYENDKNVCNAFTKYFQQKENLIPPKSIDSDIPFHFNLSILDQTSDEFFIVANHFKKTMPNSAVSFIEKVRNVCLEEMYEHTKKMISKFVPQNISIEYNLFHGTTFESIKSICRGGFNRSYCGKNGTAFGQGVYFARDASYSDKYSKLHNSLIYGGNNLHYMNSKYMNSNNSKSFSMILSKVIVGMYHKGTADMKDSPMRDETLQYDSTVDCVNNPSIFVIYKDYRAYPNYIIHYT